MRIKLILLTLAIGMLSNGIYNDAFASNTPVHTNENQLQEKKLTEKIAEMLINNMREIGGTQLKIPDEYTSIDEWAFGGCIKLKEIDFGNVNTIGERAFYMCKALDDIDFGNVNTIEKNAFQECIALENVDFKNVKTISEWAFCDCTGLKNIDFRNVNTIGECAFCGCIGLTSITIPDTVESIDDGAFIGCKNLKKIVCSERIKKLVIESGSFSLDEEKFIEFIAPNALSNEYIGGEEKIVKGILNGNLTKKAKAIKTLFNEAGLTKKLKTDGKKEADGNTQINERDIANAELDDE